MYLDLLEVALDAHRTAQLEGRGQTVVLDGETLQRVVQLQLQMNVLDDLKAAGGRGGQGEREEGESELIQLRESSHSR